MYNNACIPRCSRFVRTTTVPLVLLETSMTDKARLQALSHALLVLRLTLGLFLLQWGVEKFVLPQSTVAI